MIKEERHDEILKILDNEKYISAQELAKRLYVSLPTIRRDLSLLHKRGQIVRSHGGAKIIEAGSVVAPLNFRKTINSNKKRQLCKAAAKMINEKDIIQQSRIKGEMYTLANIKKLIAENKVSGIFKSEIERIYKISMAWKTYNQKGNKIYNIKNYKPTFRVCDIKDWDVDYNDISWLFVSGNNADRPFFKIRKFWYKYICGIMFAK